MEEEKILWLPTGRSVTYTLPSPPEGLYEFKKVRVLDKPDEQGNVAYFQFVVNRFMTMPSKCAVITGISDDDGDHELYIDKGL